MGMKDRKKEMASHQSEFIMQTLGIMICSGEQALENTLFSPVASTATT